MASFFITERSLAWLLSFPGPLPRARASHMSQMLPPSDVILLSLSLMQCCPGGPLSGSHALSPCWHVKQAIAFDMAPL